MQILLINAFKECEQSRKNIFKILSTIIACAIPPVNWDEVLKLVREPLSEFVNIITPKSSFIEKRDALDLYIQYIIDSNIALDNIYQDIKFDDTNNSSRWFNQCELLKFYIHFNRLIFDNTLALFQSCKNKTTLIEKFQKNLIPYFGSYDKISRKIITMRHKINQEDQISTQNENLNDTIITKEHIQTKVILCSLLIDSLNAMFDSLQEHDDKFLLFDKNQIERMPLTYLIYISAIIDCGLFIARAEETDQERISSYQKLYTQLSEYENFYYFVIKTNKILNTVPFAEYSKQKWSAFFRHYYAQLNNVGIVGIKSTKYIPISDSSLDEQPNSKSLEEPIELDLDLSTPPTNKSISKKKKHKKKKPKKPSAATVSYETRAVDEESNEESDEDEKLTKSPVLLSETTNSIIPNEEETFDSDQDQSTWTTVTRVLKNTHETRIFKTLCQVETIHQWQTIQKAIDDQQYQAALTMLEAIPQAQQNNDYYKALETCFAGLLRYHEAINAVRNLDVTDRTTVWLTIANYYEKLNEYHAVIYFCNKMLAQKPNYKNALITKAKAYYQLGLFIDEKNCWLQILTTNPNDKAILSQLAQCKERIEPVAPSLKTSPALNPKALPYTPLDRVVPPYDINSPVMQVTTTSAIAYAFSLIQYVPVDEAFVVGGAVTALLNNQNIRPGQDIDIIISNKHLDYMMQNRAFSLSPYASEKGYFFTVYRNIVPLKSIALSLIKPITCLQQRVEIFASLQYFSTAILRFMIQVLEDKKIFMIKHSIQ